MLACQWFFYRIPVTSLLIYIPISDEASSKSAIAKSEMELEICRAKSGYWLALNDYAGIGDGAGETHISFVP